MSLYWTGISQLCQAVQEGEITDIQDLIQEGIDVNISDSNGETALHIAVCSGYTDIVEELIQAEADVNAQNKNGQTALHLAASRGLTVLVKLLLQAHADPDIKTWFSEMTALHMASQNGHGDVVKLLLQYQANTYSHDTIQKTPNFYAATDEIEDILGKPKEEKASFKLQTPHSLSLLANDSRAYNTDLTANHTSFNKTPKANGISAYDDRETKSSRQSNARTENQTESFNQSNTGMGNQSKFFSQSNSNPENHTHRFSQLNTRTEDRSTVTIQRNTRTDYKNNDKRKFLPAREKERKQIDFKIKFSKEHKSRMQMNVFDRLATVKKT